jgi:hypothetical protein
MDERALRRELLAYHEAAHGVVMVLLGWPVRYAWIDSDHRPLLQLGDKLLCEWSGQELVHRDQLGGECEPWPVYHFLPTNRACYSQE